MSVYVMSWVWKQSDLTPGDKFLLLAIADSADDDGSNAWPTVATLARKISASESTVHRRLAKLAEAGWIKIEKNAGGSAKVRADRRPNMYTVLMTGSQSDTPSPPRGVTGDGHGVSSGTERGVTDDTQPVLDPSVEPPSGGKAAAPTVGQRANAVAKAFCDEHPLHSFHGVRAIVTRAIQAGYADQRIADVLAGLADAGKPVTVGTIRWELEGPPKFERQQHQAPSEYDRSPVSRGLDEVLW